MKNKFPLIVAIIIGLAALFAIQKYVKNMQQQAADQLKGQQVVAARVDIPAGTVITTEMLYPQEVPTRFIPAQAIQGSDNVKLIVGQQNRRRDQSRPDYFVVGFGDGNAGRIVFYYSSGPGSLYCQYLCGCKIGFNPAQRSH